MMLADSKSMTEKRVFNTSLGQTYSFSFTPLSAQEQKTDEKGPLTFDGKGNCLNLHYFQINTPRSVKGAIESARFPLPSQYIDHHSFKIAVSQWASGYDLFNSLALLPLPMGFQLYHLVEPHIPTALEKSPMTLQNRMAAKAFTPQNSPLYPSNYLQVMENLIEDRPFLEDNLRSTGPRGQPIPWKFHVLEKQPWYAQLIPVRPDPNPYASFSEFSAAMLRWSSSIASTAVIPIHPSDFKSILNIEMQPQFLSRSARGLPRIDSTDYFRYVSKPPQPDESSLLAEPQVEQSEIFPRNLPQLQLSIQIELEKMAAPATKLNSFVEPIILGLHHCYSSAFFDTSKLHRAPPVKLPFAPGAQPSFGAVNELLAFGATHPPSHKNLAAGVALSSTIEPSLIPPIVDASSLTKAFQIAKVTNSLPIRYLLYRRIYDIFCSSTNIMRDWIVSDLIVFSNVYNLFCEFSDYLHDPPILSGSENDSGLILTAQSLFVGSYLSQQMYDFFSDQLYGSKEASNFFSVRSKTFADNLENFLQVHGKALSQCFAGGRDEYLSLMFLILNHPSKQAFSLIAEFQPSIYSLLSKLSRRNNKLFLNFSCRLLNNKIARVHLVRLLSVLSEDTSIILNDSDPSFCTFLSTLLSIKYDGNAEDLDLNWSLIFVSSIVGLGEEYSDLLFSISNFVGTIVGHKHFREFAVIQLPQMESILFAALLVSPPTGRTLAILKSLRHLLWRKESDAFLEDAPTICMVTASLISNADLDVSISAMRTVKKIFMSHPNWLRKVCGDSDLLKKIANQEFAKSGPKLFYILKFILDFLKQKELHKEITYFLSFLLAMSFKYGYAISSAKRTANSRQRYCINQITQFMEENQSIQQSFRDLDKGIIGRHRK